MPPAEAETEAEAEAGAGSNGMVSCDSGNVLSSPKVTEVCPGPHFSSGFFSALTSLF